MTNRNPLGGANGTLCVPGTFGRPMAAARRAKPHELNYYISQWLAARFYVGCGPDLYAIPISSQAFPPRKHTASSAKYASEQKGARQARGGEPRSIPLTHIYSRRDQAVPIAACTLFVTGACQCLT